MSDELDLTERFPDMEPVSSPPSLFTLNGCGLMMYGERDSDRETQTYVRTQCVVLLFLPIFCLKSYRVVKASEGGWYFLGREPLSGLARGWNFAVLLILAAAAGGLGWQARNNPDDVVAGQKMDEARQRAGADDWVNAASLYDEIARGRTQHAPAAASEFQKLLDEKLPTASTPDAERALGIAVPLARRQGRAFASHLVDQQVRPLVERLGESESAAARRWLRLVEPLVDETNDPGATRSWLVDTKRKLLEAEFAATDLPGLGLLNELAVVLEQAGDHQRCETLLTPRQAELGTTEGARVLGQILARRGEYDRAYELLMPYMNERLEELRLTNERLKAQFDLVHERAMAELNSQQASARFYEEYAQAEAAGNEAKKHELVQTYIGERMREDPQIVELQEKAVSLSSAVTAAMDLGIIQLRRAQGMAGEDRDRELQNAEKSFLAVRGQLGESDTYKLFLGQVYYWMGRDAAGQQLFDELLGEERRPESVLQVATTMRDLGKDSEARALCEEAFENATDPRVKHGAVMTRSLLRIDTEDEIAWLEKADPAYPQVTISLNWARGNLALQQGKQDEAVRFIRASLEGYEKTPENSTTLNNAALACFSLANITGDQAEFERGMAKLEKAIALNPSDATLQLNAASSLQKQAVRALIRDRVELSELQVDIDADLLGAFYNDKSGYDDWMVRYRQQPATVRAVDLLAKLNVIAPKRPDSWLHLAEYHRRNYDADALKSLYDQLLKNEVEVDSTVQRWRDFQNGKSDDRIRKMVRKPTELNTKARDKHAADRDGTWAVATNSLVTMNVPLLVINETVDLNATISMAEEAYRLRPNAQLRIALIRLLPFRAAERLRDEVPELAALDRDHRRDLSMLIQLGIVLQTSPERREAIASDPDIQRTLALITDHQRLFPDSCRPTFWMLLKGLGQDSAAVQLVERMKGQEHQQYFHRVHSRLNPHLPATAIETCWHYEMLGQPEEGQKVLERCRSFGAELPALK